jgi:alkanesulfonate monooxygenase SsuD/methylene tetrahydromethanopterin reductase-like flavin-dependent oxidoreductase (luciferase family)
VWVSDHLVAPTGVQSIYPYDRRPDARPGDMGSSSTSRAAHHARFLAGATRRIRLGVSAYVLRTAARRHGEAGRDLDALSDGRLILGVGVGWLREEFGALGVPFAGRGRRTDEYLAICRALWTEPEAADGELAPAAGALGAEAGAAPATGLDRRTRAARARAARRGDGWHAIDLSPAELSPLVGSSGSASWRRGGSGRTSS